MSEPQNNINADLIKRFQDEVPGLEAGEVWFIAHTRPRCEKKLQYVCTEKNYKTYLPLRRRVLTYGNRRRESHSPLFPGYLFCIAPEADKAFFKQNRYVANVLDVYGQKEMTELLISVQKAVTCGQELEVLPFIKKGQQVRVLDGPFKGQVCEVIDAEEGTRIILNIELIQQSVSLVVDAAILGPV